MKARFSESSTPIPNIVIEVETDEETLMMRFFLNAKFYWNDKLTFCLLDSGVVSSNKTGCRSKSIGWMNELECKRGL
jgi:hypothetical protein